MFQRLLLLFVLCTTVELVILLWMSDRIGWEITLLIILGTGILGAALTRIQGLRTIARVQQDLREGRMPTTALLDGLMIVLAAAFLTTPGVLTDLFGFSLLVPFCREWYRKRLANWIKNRFHVSLHGKSDNSGTQGTRILDGVVVEPKDDDPTSEA